MSPPHTPGSSNLRGVRFEASPTTIQGDQDGDAMSKEEAEKIASIRSSRSRRRGSRSRRSPTPFVRRTPSTANSDDSNPESEGQATDGSTPSASGDNGESRRMRQRRQMAEDRKNESSNEAEADGEAMNGTK